MTEDELVREVLRRLDEIAKELSLLRSQLTPAQVNTWEQSEKAATALGLTPEQLHKLRREQFMREGEHYRAIAGGLRHRYQYHLQRCQQLLNTPPRKRKKYV